MTEAKTHVVTNKKPKAGLSPKKVYYVMLGVFCLTIILASTAVVMGNMMLQKRAVTLTDLKLRNRLLDEQQTALTKAQKDIEKYSDFANIAKTIVPQDKDQAKAVLEIIQIAKESGIVINNITFPASTLGNGGSSSTTGSTSATTRSAPAISQAKPVEGINGVYSLQLDIKPGGNTKGGPVTYPQFLDFLARLEKNRRTSQVSSLRITPVGQNPNNPTLDFNLAINIFLKP